MVFFFKLKILNIFCAACYLKVIIFDTQLKTMMLQSFVAIFHLINLFFVFYIDGTYATFRKINSLT